MDARPLKQLGENLFDETKKPLEKEIPNGDFTETILHRRHGSRTGFGTRCGSGWGDTPTNTDPVRGALEIAGAATVRTIITISCRISP